MDERWFLQQAGSYSSPALPSATRWARTKRAKWRSFCRQQADNGKFLSEFAYVNAILKARAWSVLHLWVLQGFVEPFVPCLSLRKHLQTQLQYIVRWLLCFFYNTKSHLALCLFLLGNCPLVGSPPITKTSTLWLLEVCCVGSTHSHIAACLRAFRGAVCLRGVHICAPKPLRQRPWPQDLGGFHKDPRDAVYSFSELRIRRQRSGDGVRAKGESAGGCWTVLDLRASEDEWYHSWYSFAADCTQTCSPRADSFPHPSPTSTSSQLHHLTYRQHAWSEPQCFVPHHPRKHRSNATILQP